jgi:NAD(P)H-dependent flavin oxidoreductase YrpB (nitropropane dioxygenase family)
MLHTPLCDLLSIDIPIVQAPIAPYTSPQLVAAVSNAGGLGSVGTALQSFDTVRRQVEQIRKLTNRFNQARDCKRIVFYNKNCSVIQGPTIQEREDREQLPHSVYQMPYNHRSHLHLLKLLSLKHLDLSVNKMY